MSQTMSLYNMSFSQTNLPLEENSTEDDLLNYHATYNDFLHERRLQTNVLELPIMLGRYMLLTNYMADM